MKESNIDGRSTGWLTNEMSQGRDTVTETSFEEWVGVNLERYKKRLTKNQVLKVANTFGFSVSRNRKKSVLMEMIDERVSEMGILGQYTTIIFFSGIVDGTPLTYNFSEEMRNDLYLEGKI